MYLVVGLGNPGTEYEETRHNIGFKVIDKLAQLNKISLDRQKFKGVCTDYRLGTEKVVLVKPLTYMNLSGECVVQFADYFDVPDENIIVIYDDVSLDVGRMRIRKKGSSGGQNGIKNIIKNLETDVFPRIKVGVGKHQRDLVDHVLGKFSDEDKVVMEKVVEEAARAAECIIKESTDKAMNVYNGFNAAE